MIDINAQGYQASMLVFNMIDELAKECGYENGAQDLIGEEPAVNVELLQIVQERIIAHAELRRLAMLHALQEAEEEVQRAYQ
jgi:hypothetical protein